jgi:PPOX class probable F420-dependent enzyme
MFPDDYRDLLSPEKRAYAYLATIMKDGSPQLTPVWFDMQGDNIRINTARGRVKEQNMRDRRRVALVIADPEDPFRFLQVRGRVIEISEAGSLEHFYGLAKKYTGEAKWKKYSGERRVIFTIEPENISTD